MATSSTGWYSGGNTATKTNDKKWYGEGPSSWYGENPSKSSGSSGGSSGGWNSTFMIFHDEIMRMSAVSLNPPIFDMGVITEIIGTRNFKYKVKMMAMGTVVTATGGDTTAALFSWSKPTSMYLKGATVLVLCTPTDLSRQNTTITYSIVSVRQTGAFAPTNVAEYPV